MQIWTIREIHTGEAVTEQGEPVLFDTEREAQDWALARYGENAGREYTIEEV